MKLRNLWTTAHMSQNDLTRTVFLPPKSKQDVNMTTFYRRLNWNLRQWESHDESHLTPFSVCLQHFLSNSLTLLVIQCGKHGALCLLSRACPPPEFGHHCWPLQKEHKEPFSIHRARSQKMSRRAAGMENWTLKRKPGQRTDMAHMHLNERGTHRTGAEIVGTSFEKGRKGQASDYWYSIHVPFCVLLRECQVSADTHHHRGGFV